MSNSKTAEQTENGISLSVVVPLFNEEESLRELHKQICEVCMIENILFEVIYVDDGSTDRSFEVLDEMFEEDSRIKVIQFRKNAGKSVALSAGFSKASGDFVVMMDGDLQDDPAEIPTLITRLEEGYDLISGWKIIGMATISIKPKYFKSQLKVNKLRK